MRGNLSRTEVTIMNQHTGQRSARNKNVNPEKNCPSFWKQLSWYFYDYSNKTTIQAIKYLGEKNRSPIEKLFWIIFLTVSICLCGQLINLVYYRWQNDNVIITFSNKLTSVWSIPFPAVTICPEWKLKRSLYNYTDTYQQYILVSETLTKEELHRFEQMNYLCGDLRLLHGSKTIGFDTLDFIFRVAPTCDEWMCYWGENSHLCNTSMTPIITDDGVCFTFNMLDREELFTSSYYHKEKFFKHSSKWTLEKGYTKGAGTKNDYPRRTIAGSKSLQIILIDPESELDYGCGGNVGGYKVLLHHPGEIARLQHLAFLAPVNIETLVAIKPAMTTTSAELENYDPEQRQCYFSYEKQLKYFQVYTHSNCELECLANYTLNLCGCAHFYMPRDPTTQFCGRANYGCVNTANEIMVNREMELEGATYANEFANSYFLNESPECKCLPSCTSLSYDTETSAISNEWKKTFEVKDLSFDKLDYMFTKINFYYKTPKFVTTERKELYGFTDFLANCGGLLGLFIGFSFLSMVEIVYFLTLRLICNIKVNGLHFWYGLPRMGVDKEVAVSKNSTIAVSDHSSNNVASLKHTLTAIDFE